MHTLIQWFQKPYPFPATPKAKILISLGFGKFVFLFLYIFQPFNFGELDEKDLLFAIMFGLITTFIMFLNSFLLPLIFPIFFNTNKWVIYKMTIFVLGTILMIGVVNWFSFNQTVRGAEVEQNGLGFFMSSTALIGFFPLLFYLYISEKVKFKEHKTIADSISKVKNTTIRVVNKDVKNEILIKLYGENKKEVLELVLDDLLFISYEKNYSSVYHNEAGKIKEKLLRISLSKLEKQLSDYKNIVRCHKSYIVNTHQVEEIQGNARSYLLKIKQNDSRDKPMLIPVSRTFPKQLLFTLIG